MTHDELRAQGFSWWCNLAREPYLMTNTVLVWNGPNAYSTSWSEAPEEMRRRLARTYGEDNVVLHQVALTTDGCLVPGYRSLWVREV